MSAEAVQMAKNAVAAAVRGEVDAQYHWAKLLELDALARGARGPEMDEFQSASAYDAVCAAEKFMREAQG